MNPRRRRFQRQRRFVRKVIERFVADLKANIRGKAMRPLGEVLDEQMREYKARGWIAPVLADFPEDAIHRAVLARDSIDQAKLAHRIQAITVNRGKP